MLRRKVRGRVQRCPRFPDTAIIRGPLKSMIQMVGAVELNQRPLQPTGDILIVVEPVRLARMKPLLPGIFPMYNFIGVHGR